MNSIDTIYWINLDRSVERYERMTTMFKHPVFKNIKNIQRIQAYDGQDAKLIRSLIYNYDPSIDKFNKLTSKEYACVLSHFNAIRTYTLSSYTGYALIMEDDMTLELYPYWQTSIDNALKNAPSDWDIVQLAYMSPDMTGLLHPYRLYESNCGSFFSCGAYVIRKQSAIRFISDHYISETDQYVFNKEDKDNLLTRHEADIYIYCSLKTYVYKYPFFIYGFTENTTLDHRTDHHDKSKITTIEIMIFEYNRKQSKKRYYIMLFICFCILLCINIITQLYDTLV